MYKYSLINIMVILFTCIFGHNNPSEDTHNVLTFMFCGWWSQSNTKNLSRSKKKTETVY